MKKIIISTLFLGTILNSGTISDSKTLPNIIENKSEYHSFLYNQEIQNDSGIDYFNFNLNLNVLNKPIFSGLIKKREDFFQKNIDPTIEKMESIKNENMRRINFGNEEYTKLLNQIGIKGSSTNSSNYLKEKITSIVTGVSGYDKILEMLDELEKKDYSTQFTFSEEISKISTIQKFRKELYDIFYGDRGLVPMIDSINIVGTLFKGTFGNNWEKNYEKLINDIKLSESIISGEYIQTLIDNKDKDMVEKNKLYADLRKGDYVRSTIENFVTENPKMFGLTPGKNYNIFDQEYIDNLKIKTNNLMSRNNLCDIMKCFNTKNANTQKECEMAGISKEQVSEQINNIKDQLISIVLIRTLEQVLQDIVIERAVNYLKKASQCTITATLMHSNSQEGTDTVLVGKDTLLKCVNQTGANFKDTEEMMSAGIKLQQQEHEFRFWGYDVVSIWLPSKITPQIEIGGTFYDNYDKFEKCLDEETSKEWMEKYKWCMENVDTMDINFSSFRLNLKNDLFREIEEFKRVSCENNQRISNKPKNYVVELPHTLELISKIKQDKYKENINEIYQSEKNYVKILNKEVKISKSTKDENFECSTITPDLNILFNFEDKTRDSVKLLDHKIKLENTRKYLNKDFKNISEVYPYLYFENNKEYYKELSNTCADNTQKMLDLLKILKNNENYCNNFREEELELYYEYIVNKEMFNFCQNTIQEIKVIEKIEERTFNAKNVIEQVVLKALKNLPNNLEKNNKNKDNNIVFEKILNELPYRQLVKIDNEQYVELTESEKESLNNLKNIKEIINDLKSIYLNKDFIYINDNLVYGLSDNETLFINLIYNNLLTLQIEEDLVEEQKNIYTYQLEPSTREEIKEFVNPVEKMKITDTFDKNRFHPKLKIYRPHLGVDIGLEGNNKDIYSSNDGIVEFAGTKNGYGKIVEIKHENGFNSVYAHLDTIIVKNNQFVKRGEKIGEMGNTGISTETHLHFELIISDNRKLEELKEKYKDKIACGNNDPRCRIDPTVLLEQNNISQIKQKQVEKNETVIVQMERIGRKIDYITIRTYDEN